MTWQVIVILCCLVYGSKPSHGRPEVTKDFVAARRSRAMLFGTKANPINLTVCWLLEDDSYYSSYERLAAAIDLAISNANAYILPETVRLKLAFQRMGPSCSGTQFTAVANTLQLLGSGVSCDIFVGAGCPTTAVAIYGIAHHLDIAIMGCPGAGTASLALSADLGKFPLLIRAAFGFTDVSAFLNAFVTGLGYTHLCIIRDDSYNFYTLLSKFILGKLRDYNPSLYYSVFESPVYSVGSNLTNYKDLLEKADDRTRVLLLLAHGDAVRQIMIAAHQLGFTTGDYVFLAVELFQLNYWGEIRSDHGDAYDGVAKDAFRSLMVMALKKKIPNSDVQTFEEKVKLAAKHFYNYTFRPLEKMDITILAHYESIMIYAQEAAAMINGGLDELDGTAMVGRMMGAQYHGVSGPVRIGINGERDNDFEFLSFDLKTEEFEPYWEYVKMNFTYTIIRPVKSITWPSPTGQLPPNEPKCGFRGEKCVAEMVSNGYIAAAVAVPSVLVVGVTIFSTVFFLRLRKLRRDYNPHWWRVFSEELTIRQNRTASTVSKRTLASQSTSGPTRSTYVCDILAAYKGNLVALTDVTGFKKFPGAEIINQLNLLKACASPNLQKFIGIGVTNTGMCEFVVNELCAKGSLTDVLGSDLIKLDWNFKNNLIKDIVFGMAYLHTTPIVSHGNLNSHTCLIDARFTLKVADYGLPCFRNLADLQPPGHNDSERSYQLLLWRAPELLRRTMPREGTQKGDVYSFAILLQQIILRSGPFDLPSDPLELTDREIVQEVVAMNIPPVRPRVPRSSCSNELYDLMERCWEEFPVERPTFLKIKERLKKVIGDVGDNIVDLLFKRMEHYAADLELKVAEKTQQFMEEKRRSEELLSQLLPRPVAAALTRGEHVEPEAFASVTIFFSDIVDFTTISAAGSPMDVIGLLNGLYTFFDSVIEKQDVYKVETIGDAYMVSSGLPARNGNRHVVEIATMALALMKGIKLVLVPNRPTVAIEIRAGINSGPCVAGVVGLKMPRYCLFGDTVNVASRMESTGEPMKIQITSETKDLLTSIGGFVITERGPIVVKGKGTLITHWLTSSGTDRP